MSPHPDPLHDSDPDPLDAYLARTAPCPAWCEHTGPHGYDHDPWAEPTHRWQRSHTRNLHDDTRWPVTLSVHQQEVAAAPDAPPSPDRPQYLLTVPHCAVELTSPADLHAFATLLLTLAEHVAAHPFGAEAER